MQSVMVDPGLEIKGYRRTPEVSCPPSGLVINPAVGCVNVWNLVARDSGDIVQPYNALQFPNAAISDTLRAEGLRIASKNGHAALATVSTVAPPPLVATQDANSPFQATNFSV